MNKTQYKKAKKLLSDKSNWIQGIHSRDKQGRKCLYSDIRAVRYCALTACNLFAKETDHSRKELILAAKQLGYLSITHLNDSGTHEDVMKMFDIAIGFCDGKTILQMGIEVSDDHKFVSKMEGVSFAGATTGRFSSANPAYSFV